MLVKTAKNRAEIKKYLMSISEDDLINEVIVPLYNSFGYSVLRVVTHGPGEHGKDLVVYKYSHATFGNEYIAIQAKAQKVDTSNITGMANQLIRALRTPIKGLSGGSEFLPNYVIHFNSQTVTNDAHWEFPYLVDGKDNIKIISQDNIIDLMLDNDIVPIQLNSKLEEVSSNVANSISRAIQQTLFSGNPAYIEALFENVISISKDQIDLETKHIIIEYIFKKWNEDKRWAATVKPMKWLDMCFDFMTIDQYKYLKEVLDEYTSSYPSYDASCYVENIINKMTISHYLEIKDYFIQKTIHDYRSREKKNLHEKFLSFVNQEPLDRINQNENDLKSIIEKIETLRSKRNLTDSDRHEWNDLDRKLTAMEYGEEYCRITGV